MSVYDSKRTLFSANPIDTSINSDTLHVAHLIIDGPTPQGQPSTGLWIGLPTVSPKPLDPGQIQIGFIRLGDGGLDPRVLASSQQPRREHAARI